jgi:hypothetical protein
MVILSLPSMSNSFLGHPDRDRFSAESNQATLIQINHVRYRTLILPPPAAPIVRYAAGSLFAMPQDLLLSHSSQYTADRQATQRRRISRLRPIIRFYSFCFFSPERFSPTYVEVGGRRLPGAVSK